MVAAAATTVMAQEQDFMTYHSCDFTEGIPADYTTHDLDGQTLHYTMVQAGIKQGQAWARKKESGVSNYYAMSACRYKSVDGSELKPSDDWLITPVIWIRGGDAKLSWRGISVTNLLDEGAGYEILVSTTGNNPEDFTTPVFTISEESLDEWTTHEVDLSAYAGQHIYIAFHNNSATGEILGIDDIAVSGLRGICNFEVTTGSYIYETKELAISTGFTSYSESPITHINLSFTCGDVSEEITLDGLNINKYETYHYTFPTTIPVEYSDTLHYTVSATVQGIPQDDIHCTTISMAFQTKRMTVVEEATGMWCQYCPSGIAAFEILEEKYPEQFIGLALHADDLLGVDQYTSDLGFPEGFPTAWVNRATYVEDIMTVVKQDGRDVLVPDNGGIETIFVDHKDVVATMGVFINNAVVDGEQIAIDATVRPAIDFDNVRCNLAFVIVEDSVWKEGYYQNNNYSESKEEYLAGWYERPRVILEDFAFNHVVRTIYNNYQGIEGSIPTTLVAGEEYTYSHTFDMPDYLNIENVHVVAMIINLDSGEIMNACRCDMGTTAVESVQVQAAQCYAQGRDLQVVLPALAKARVNVYTTTGQHVASLNTQQSYNSIALDAAGVYIVTITGQEINETHKVIVR